MNARKLTLSVLLALATLALAAVSAQAALVHAYLPKPSEEVTKGINKSTAEVNAMATDSSGALYTVETDGGTGNRLAKFDLSSGALVSQFAETPGLSYFEGVAVAHSTGEVYIAADDGSWVIPETPTKKKEEGIAGAVAVFNAAGSLQKIWRGVDTKDGEAGYGFRCFDCGGPGAVAVDNSSNPETQGDVYVAAPEEGVVDVFKPGAGGIEETKPVAEIGGTSPSEPFESLTAVAVDESNSDVLVGAAANGEAVVDVFKPTVLGEYEFVRQITGTPGAAFSGRISGIATADVGGEDEIYVSVKSYSNPAANVVDQFNSEGVYRGRLTGISQTQPFKIPLGVAVDPSSGDVAVDDSGSTVDVFGPSAVIPGVITGPSSTVTPRSATLTGTVKLEGEGEATCQFAWGTTPAFGQIVPCSAPVTGEESSVHATLSQASHSELQPDTTYYYRLQAANRKNGVLNPGGPQEPQPECEGKPAAVACFTTSGPAIHSESVSEITNTSATLQAAINANGASTSYYFQYSTADTAGCTPSTCVAVPAAPGLPIGSGSGDVPVEQEVQGLSEGALYHYRVVAVSEVPVEVEPGRIETKTESFYGPDRTFTVQGAGAFALPDGRQWEMVSPPDIRGARIEALDTAFEFAGAPVQAAAGGGGIAYILNEPSETDVPGFVQFVATLSTRGAGSWSSRTLGIPHAPATPISLSNVREFGFFSEDLSHAVVQPLGPFVALSPDASEQTAYVANLQSGEYTPLFTGCPAEGEEPCAPSVEEHADVPPGTVFGAGPCENGAPCGPQWEGATPDLRHVLVGGDEWSAGEPPSEELQPLDAVPTSLSPLDHQLSDDGSVFYDSEGHLFLQDVARHETVRLDVAQGVSEPSEGHAAFLYASSDGSTVLFSDSDQLTSAPGGGIYECRIAEVEGRLACAQLVLTGLSGGTLLGGSEDASYVYLLGQANTFYVDHREGSEWKQTPIASVSSEDNPDWAPELQRRTSRVSPNGEWFAFMSQRSLTGYDNRDASSGIPDEEVYLYSTKTGRLVCASCNPTGARPQGVEIGSEETQHTLVGGFGEWPGTKWLAANVPAWTQLGEGPTVGRENNTYERLIFYYQPRYLSDGGRLFFNSSDALVPKDVNSQEDVYEYEPEGVPTGAHACAPSSVSGSEVFKPAHSFEAEGREGEEPAGCVALISSGTSPAESGFMDASENGGDVFFLTASHLVAQDVENGLALYDAHECTSSSPCFAETASPPACITVEGCRAAAEPQPPSFGAPSSSTFSGAGNITPPGPAAVVKAKAKGCQTGFTKRKGKCVRSKAKRKRKKRVKGARRSTAGAISRGRARS
jgi:hypothetical protein